MILNVKGVKQFKTNYLGKHLNICFEVWITATKTKVVIGNRRAVSLCSNTLLELSLYICRISFRVFNIHLNFRRKSSVGDFPSAIS